ncbi:methionine ABC transporter ATP-binding protein [Pseudalkalibacillus caeni]|uniref:Methionine ABC transporter ATP-binding protein n=1 Tax=Exobacillus caeni TaxID=2574798 RepID=A0A5R9F5K4_9BACL|nr:methionine ABC transporter ATP-binding protein [Pseudalkalibacillus caeni]TLS38807.1 methionine ABC transporter ATP-binding protein [Pseudalkalibacillus caeni]
MITLKGLHKTFNAKSGVVKAVDDVNIEIEKGEIFGIIGYSGAGKSTLIRMLNLLERPTDGTVSIDGMDLSRLKGKELRKARQEISMVFQHFNLLWSRTVKENIAFPLEIAGVSSTERKKRVDELVKLVGLEGRENAYPSQLSGGQKQRVGIARALANNPKVLLCDEATSALDPKTTDSILDLLVDINKQLGLTIVLITHEMHVIRKICHRVAVMENGRIVEQGHVLEVFQNPKEDITRDFVNQLADPGDIHKTLDHLAEEYPEGKVVNLTFVQESAEKPLISDVLRKFAVDINILQGKISQTQEGAYGKLSVLLQGEEKDIQEAIAYMESHHVGVEVIQNA